MELGVKIKRMRESAVLPEYATPDSAACDLHACIEQNTVIPPRGSVKIPTGIAIAPRRSDAVSLVFSRSGMGVRDGITLSNSVGVIDADYRGEIIVSLVNHSDREYTVKPGDRVAQLMFVPVLHAVFEEAVELEDTERGEGGFGSTGR